MKTGTRIALLSTLLIFFTINRVSAQVLPDSTIQKINNFFAGWNNSYSPGCAIGIVTNDSLIFANCYGMANLEYVIPNTPETIFHMASVRNNSPHIQYCYW